MTSDTHIETTTIRRAPCFERLTQYIRHNACTCLRPRRNLVRVGIVVGDDWDAANCGRIVVDDDADGVGWPGRWHGESDRHKSSQSRGFGQM